MNLPETTGKILLWLDDMRDPHKNDWLNFSPIPKLELRKVYWAKSYDDFVRWISIKGLPDGICFDHDLSDFQAMKTSYPELMEDVPWPDSEKTGMDCARWLIEYCKERSLSLPVYMSQASNPDKRAEIVTLLDNFKNDVV